MHDIKEIRENLKEFSNQIKKRNVDVKFDEILELDKENRSLIQEKEKLESEKKSISKSKDKEQQEREEQEARDKEQQEREEQEARDKAQPIQENIDKINKLYDEGNTIVYWTARGSRKQINWEELTKQQLDSWGAKYHELKVDKPFYDLFIEDKALRIEEL